MIAGKSLLKMSCKKNTCDKEAKRTLETFFSGNPLFHFMSIESAKVLFFDFLLLFEKLVSFLFTNPVYTLTKEK